MQYVKNKNLILVLGLFILTLVPIFGGTFMTVEAENIGGDDIKFPQDALKEGPALFAIAMGTSRESGERQQIQLLEWEQYIKQGSTPLARLPYYHFPIIEAPRFVHGLIRRGISKSYEPMVGPSQAAVIFIKDTNKFATQAEIPVDDQATVALVLPDSRIAGYIKGEPTETALKQLQELFQQHLD